MKKLFYLFFVPLLSLSSCFGGSSATTDYVGTWVGSSTEETTASRDLPYNNRTTTSYTITIEKSGSCQIIEKTTGQAYNESVDNTYTFFGTWETKDGYIGDGEHYKWIELNGTTKVEHDFVESNSYGNWNSSNKVATTLSITPDGKMWRGSLDAKKLASENSYSGVTQLRKQN